VGHAGSGDAVYLMDVAAGHPERGVVGADGLFVRAVEQAVDLAVVVVVQLDLAHAELVGPGVAGMRVFRFSYGRAPSDA
jgi:hypothetical protein